MNYDIFFPSQQHFDIMAVLRKSGTNHAAQ